MAQIKGVGLTNIMDVDAHGRAKTGLFDANGNEIFKSKGGAYASTDQFIPMAGLNDGVYRPTRVDRFGGQAIARFTPQVTLNLYTAALPPNWLAPATTMTVTYATTSGALVNAGASAAASVNAALISMAAVPKYQKSPVMSRHRARIIKGGANAIADWGLSTSQAPGPAVLANGLVFLYGADGTLKPTIYYNSAVGVQGADFAASVLTDRYYVWDIVFDDDSATFTVQDPNTGTIINEQTLNISQLASRMGQLPYFFSHARCYQTATAGTGAATQLYVSDATALLIDTDMNRAWPHTQAINGCGSVVNPTVAMVQLENYANSAAPTSATLSNTAAGYTTLGGQWQFAAPAGAETDYALFGYQVPTGVKLVVTGIRIETLNNGAVVATTATVLQWFAGVDGTAVTLAANNFRKSLGLQGFGVGAVVGALAAPIDCRFGTPLVTNSGRFFHLGVKVPIGTATGGQIIRGTAQIEGYFE